MKKVLVFCTLFALIHVINVFSQESNTMKTVKFENYSISHPSDLDMYKDGDGFTIYLNQRDNLAMKVDDLSGYNYSLSEFSTQYIEYLQSQYNTTVLQNKRATTGNLPCQQIICTFGDGHGKTMLKSMYYIWVKNNWAYTLSFTCAPSNFDELKPVALKVMNSFRISQ